MEKLALAMMMMSSRGESLSKWVVLMKAKRKLASSRMKQPPPQRQWPMKRKRIEREEIRKTRSGLIASECRVTPEI